jgi:2,3-bisphosphoglycerate-independent phosphoglycerate mutase
MTKEQGQHDKQPAVKPLVLMILDGWGHRQDAPDNAISQAGTPNWDRLKQQGCHTTIETSGESVGLPAGQMGNSGVGHMNIGAGRIVFQDFTRVSQAVDDGSITRNPALVKTIKASREHASTLHIMGLLSPGGVHSHEDHFLAMVQMAANQGAHQIRVHAFLDGRDTPPRSAEASIARMQDCLDELDNAAFASLCGRYYAMDRDKRWDRVEQAWNMLVNAQASHTNVEAGAALLAAYDRDENDEFVSPTVIADYAGMKDNDAIVFINFRADRAREISQAFTEPEFDGFKRHRPALSAFVCMTQYLEGMPADIAFPTEQLHGLLGECLSNRALSQLRIAETEKYAHVTFFFNGGEEQLFPGESRILVPSPKVATYDLQPEMSAPELSVKLDEAIRSGEYDVVICNVANPDMVGHTGSLEAAVAAVEAVDDCLGVTIEALRATGSHTAHTTNPVPLVYLGRPARILAGGSLRDIAPTILYLLGITPPVEMTGRSLIEFKNEPSLES